MKAYEVRTDYKIGKNIETDFGTVVFNDKEHDVELGGLFNKLLTQQSQGIITHFDITEIVLNANNISRIIRNMRCDTFIKFIKMSIDEQFSDDVDKASSNKKYSEYDHVWDIVSLKDILSSIPKNQTVVSHVHYDSDKKGIVGDLFIPDDATNAEPLPSIKWNPELTPYENVKEMTINDIRYSSAFIKDIFECLHKNYDSYHKRTIATIDFSKYPTLLGIHAIEHIVDILQNRFNIECMKESENDRVYKMTYTGDFSICENMLKSMLK